MKTYLVGLNGEHTPDPEYWRARNAFIKAESEWEAKQKWIQMREGWFREDERPYIQTRVINLNADLVFPDDFRFTERGFEYVHTI